MGTETILKFDFILTIIVFYICAVALCFVKRNAFIGLRIKYALSSESNWKSSNRFLGILILFATTLLLISFVLDCGYMISTSFFLSIVVVGVFLSYLYSRSLYLHTNDSSRRLPIIYKKIFFEGFCLLLTLWLIYIGYNFINQQPLLQELKLNTPFNVPEGELGKVSLSTYVQENYLFQIIISSVISLFVFSAFTIRGIVEKNLLELYFSYRIFFILTTIFLGFGLSNFVATYIAYKASSGTDYSELNWKILSMYYIGPIFMIGSVFICVIFRRNIGKPSISCNE